MLQESYPQLAIREFRRLKKLGEEAMAQIGSPQFFASPSAGDNSVAIIVKHMGGNLVSRWSDFLTADGEKPGRNRDTEFELGPDDSRESLMSLWEKGWALLFEALEPLTGADLERTVTIRGETLSVIQAINRQLTHYAYHVGQIVYVAKHFAGPSWRSLSIPRGASAQFNREPEKYVRKS